MLHPELRVRRVSRHAARGPLQVAIVLGLALGLAARAEAARHQPTTPAAQTRAKIPVDDVDLGTLIGLELRAPTRNEAAPRPGSASPVKKPPVVPRKAVTLPSLSRRAGAPTVTSGTLVNPGGDAGLVRKVANVCAQDTRVAVSAHGSIRFGPRTCP